MKSIITEYDDDEEDFEIVMPENEDEAMEIVDLVAPVKNGEK
jgi:hypothetical protein